jgi:hypothetical protein
MAETRQAITDRRGVRNFYERLQSKPAHEQAIFWLKTKTKYESSKQAYCAVCKMLNIPQREAGRYTKFYRTDDGKLVAECGGREDGVPVCKGFVVQREAYLDRATVTQELQQTGEVLRKNIKHIRDRVLATESFTDEDKELFKSLTEEYQSVRVLEEDYKRAIASIPSTIAKATSVEDEILVPDAYFGVTEGIRFKTPMIYLLKSEKDKPLETLDIVLVPVCKDDIPVKVL